MSFWELTARNLFLLCFIFIAANMPIQVQSILLPCFMVMTTTDDDRNNDDDEDNDHGDNDDDDDDDDANLPIQAPPILPFCLLPISDCAASSRQLSLCDEWARITLNYFQIALRRCPTHLGYHE